MPETIKVLLIGDINGRPGRNAVKALIPVFKKRYPNLAFIIANAENAASGVGLTEKTAKELFDAGADVLTMGNHTWDNRGILSFIAGETRIVRPANYTDEAVPGIGYGIYKDKLMGASFAVINLLGQVEMRPILDSPFKVVDRILNEIKGKADYIFVDFHAEATSEKGALGWYLDGRVTAVFGTHTHVQTNDARMLKNHTAYVTDIGMTGGMDGVIGVTLETVLPRFLTGMPTKFEVCEDNVMLNGALVTLDTKTKTAVEIELVQEALL